MHLPLEMAQKQSQHFMPPPTYANTPFTSANAVKSSEDAQQIDDSDISGAGLNALSLNRNDCGYCGYKWHPRRNCPARDELCRKCGKKGHFQKVFQNKKNTSSVASAVRTQKPSTHRKSSVLCASELTSGMLATSMTEIKLQNKYPAEALVDTGSEDNFISQDVVNLHNMKLMSLYSPETVFLACSSSTSKVLGYCICDITLNGKRYTNVRFKVLKNLVCDVILGLAFMKRHCSVEFILDGDEDSLKIYSEYSSAQANCTSEDSFCNLTTLKT